MSSVVMVGGGDDYTFTGHHGRGGGGEGLGRCAFTRRPSDKKK
jgi:hypothetical protein